MPPKRMTANRAKPARYRAGKPLGSESSESDSGADSDTGAPKADRKPQRRKIAPPPKATSAGQIISRGNAKIDLGAAGVTDRRRQQQQAAEDEQEKARRAAARAEAERRAREEGFVTDDDDDDDDDDGKHGAGGTAKGGIKAESESESETSEDGSSEEEGSSSEEETAPRRATLMRPRFISKKDRDGTATTSRPAADDEEAARRQEEKAQQARQKAADTLVETQIRKDLAARHTIKRHWEDEAIVVAADSDSDSDVEGAAAATAAGVDDTDGLDPAAEEAAWRLRELKRIRRERDVYEAREREQAELDRRRDLTEDQRRAEDEARIAGQQADKDARGKMAYMAKYHHRGVFFADDAAAAGLAQRDVMGARFQDDVRNRELLPKGLQLRDMTKLGRKGASKYRDLKSEDTGRWGQAPARPGGDGRGRGEDDWRRERDGGGGAAGAGDGAGGKGANAIPLGEPRNKRRREDSR